MYTLKLKHTTLSVSFHKFSINMVHCSDIPRVVDYLVEYYFTDEPLSKYTKLTKSSEAVSFIRKFCTDALHQNVSIIATTSDGQIAGISCNMIIRKHETFDFGTHPDIKKISNFVMKMVDESALYELYPDLEDYMYIAFMSVHHEFRNQGLAKRLIHHTRDLASELGLNVMRMDCCSLYTAKAAQRLGWTCLKEIEYENYKIDGEQVFCPEEPHSTFGVYAMKIGHDGFLESSV